MGFFTDFAQRSLTLWNGLNQSEQMLVGALGAILAYLLLRSLLRALPGMAMGVLLFVVGFVALRLVMPEAFCSVRWPAAVAFMCGG